MILLMPLIVSCGPDEKPPSPIPGPTDQDIEIDASANGIHYYSLKDKRIVSSSGITDWDLSFSCEETKFYIYLNTAKRMRLAKYDGYFSDSVVPEKLTGWKTDMVFPGKLKSALGTWGDFSFSNPQSFGYTYILDLGYLNHPGEFGYVKIQILGCSAGTYRLLYSSPGKSAGDTLEIKKDERYNHVFLSFSQPSETRHIEPVASDWDLLFTQSGLNQVLYRDSVPVDTFFTWTDFVWMNPSNRDITCDTVNSFGKISFWDAQNYSYTKVQDYIGNRWRAFDPIQGTYYLTRRNVYILRNTIYIMYKFSFTRIDKTAPGLTRMTIRIQNI